MIAATTPAASFSPSGGWRWPRLSDSEFPRSGGTCGSRSGSSRTSLTGSSVGGRRLSTRGRATSAIVSSRKFSTWSVSAWCSLVETSGCAAVTSVDQAVVSKACARRPRRPRPGRWWRRARAVEPRGRGVEGGERPLLRRPVGRHEQAGHKPHHLSAVHADGLAGQPAASSESRNQHGGGQVAGRAPSVEGRAGSSAS